MHELRPWTSWSGLSKEEDNVRHAYDVKDPLSLKPQWQSMLPKLPKFRYRSRSTSKVHNFKV